MCLLTHWDGLWLPTGEIIASNDTDIIGKTSNQIWSISLVQKNSMVDIWCSINAHIDTPITAWNSVVGDTVCVTACLSFLQWNKFSVGALVIRLVNYRQLEVRRPLELGYGNLKPRYCLADAIYSQCLCSHWNQVCTDLSGVVEPPACPEDAYSTFRDIY